jgi:Flp pilus assembly protein TadD
MAKYAAKDTTAAVAAYKAAIKVAPAEPQIAMELALLYERMGRVDDAISCYETLYTQNPHVKAVANNLAMLLVTYKKDRVSLDRARDLTADFASSEDGSLLDTTGWVHFKRAEYSAALPVLEKAVKRAPNSQEVHYHLGMTELRAGQPERARSDLEVAIAGPAKFSGADEARAALATLKSGAG